MKNEILDEIVYDDFHSLLKDREKIIWEGRPSTGFFTQASFWQSGSSAKTKISDTLSLLGILFFLLVVLLIIIGSIDDWDYKNILSTPRFLIFLFAISLIVGAHFFSNFKQRKTKYIISNHRILFQLWKNEAVFLQNFRMGHVEHHDIPFSEINNIVIVEERLNKGVIFLSVKNPNHILFETYNFKTGDRRHQITLEMIEDVNEVGEYIKTGIKGKL